MTTVISIIANGITTSPLGLQQLLWILLGLPITVTKTSANTTASSLRPHSSRLQPYDVRAQCTHRPLLHYAMASVPKKALSFKGPVCRI